MLQNPTRISGITAVHSYKFPILGPLLFASLCHRGSSLPQRRGSRNRFSSGGTGLRLVPFAQTPSAHPLRLRCFDISSARLLAASLTGEGGIPNSSPSRPRLLLGAAEASTIMRAKPRPLSATPRTFARERLRFLQCQKNNKGFF